MCSRSVPRMTNTLNYGWGAHICFTVYECGLDTELSQVVQYYSCCVVLAKSGYWVRPPTQVGQYVHHIAASTQLRSQPTAVVTLSHVNKPVIAMNHDSLSVDHPTTDFIVPGGVFLSSSDDNEAGCPGIIPHQAETILVLGPSGVIQVIH